MTSTLSLTEVKNLLKGKKKYKWEAGETSVSHLSMQQVTGMAYFGVGSSENELAKTEPNLQFYSTSLSPPPTSVDWRNKGGKNFVTAIRNQHECGSCVAFATCAAIEARDAVLKGVSDPTIDLSEAHLFFCGCGMCCSTGWQPSAALVFAINPGIGEESSFPYTPTDQPCKKPKVSSVIKIKSSTTASSLLDRQYAVSIGGPVIAALKVFRDFPYYKGGIYKPVTNELLGLHAVCVIGYDSVSKYWIIKNSWGPGWGSGGFGRIAFNTACEIDGQFPFWVPVL